MSAKKSSQQARSTPNTAAASGAAVSPSGEVAAQPSVPWIESSDPRRRRIGQIALVVIWVYVAALWLLAIDQWFNLGIFGPKIPPLP